MQVAPSLRSVVVVALANLAETPPTPSLVRDVHDQGLPNLFLKAAQLFRAAGLFFFFFMQRWADFFFFFFLSAGDELNEARAETSQPALQSSMYLVLMEPRILPRKDPRAASSPPDLAMPGGPPSQIVPVIHPSIRFPQTHNARTPKRPRPFCNPTRNRSPFFVVSCSVAFARRRLFCRHHSCCSCCSMSISQRPFVAALCTGRRPTTTLLSASPARILRNPPSSSPSPMSTAGPSAVGAQQECTRVECLAKDCGEVRSGRGIAAEARLAFVAGS